MEIVRAIECLFLLMLGYMGTNLGVKIDTENKESKKGLKVAILSVLGMIAAIGLYFS